MKDLILNGIFIILTIWVFHTVFDYLRHDRFWRKYRTHLKDG
jgi:hypothetical protein